jgi:Fur family transcriptional regulator, ferric uptake regulator
VTGADPARVEEVLGQLRARGGRVTTPRRAILKALLQADDHVTADDLLARVQATHPDIHTSTVYRTLETLAGLGVVDHVHLGHGRAVYHLADHRHQHLLCTGCGLVTEAPDDVLGDLTRRLDQEYGFALQARHFALTGRCRRCRTG